MALQFQPTEEAGTLVAWDIRMCDTSSMRTKSIDLWFCVQAYVFSQCWVCVSLSVQHVSCCGSAAQVGKDLQTCAHGYFYKAQAKARDKSDTLHKKLLEDATQPSEMTRHCIDPRSSRVGVHVVDTHLCCRNEANDEDPRSSWPIYRASVVWFPFFN